MTRYNVCKSCKEKHFIGGQAITKYICPHCFIEYIHSNTAIPKLCYECSKMSNRCQRCCKEIKEELTNDN